MTAESRSFRSEMSYNSPVKYDKIVPETDINFEYGSDTGKLFFRLFLKDLIFGKKQDTKTKIYKLQIM